MKGKLIALITGILLSTSTHALQLTNPAQIENLEFRGDGHHAIYLQSFTNDLSRFLCDLDDRAIILVDPLDPNFEGNKAMLGLAKDSYLYSRHCVVLGIRGCVPISSETTLTAPHVKKLQVAAVGC